MENYAHTKFMHCDEMQVNVGNINIMEKGSNFCSN